MEDFIFRTLITDELKLVDHRAENRGIQHDHTIDPADPRPFEVVRLTVKIGPELDLERVACYFTNDGSIPAGQRGVPENGQAIYLHLARVEWDTLLWGYVQVWQAEIPAQQDGVLVRYKIGAWKAEGEEIFANWPDAKHYLEASTNAHFQNRPFPEVVFDTSKPADVFSYHVDRFTPPQWARQAVIYHIFVDRFYPGDGVEWKKTEGLRGFYGGTLWGVRDKLDHIQELGATAIWLSPTWPSPTYHGYDVTDYKTVEERLGGEKALRALVEEAHRRGLRVMLDLVCNHLSHTHPIFLEAQNDPESPYRKWFTFDESKYGYRSFFGVKNMPQIDLSYPAAREWMFENARFWLEEYDIDGYRLDHANGPGPGFWAEFRAVCRSVKPDSFCFGEVVESPEKQRHYLGSLDGLLDFNFGDAVRKTFGYQTWSEPQLERFLNRHAAFFRSNDFLMPTLLDNHDMDRFLLIAGGDKERLRRAAQLQFQMPGPPIIYYGTEVGLSQRQNYWEAKDLAVSRDPMLWGADQDRDLFVFYQQLIRERNAARPWE